MMRFMTCSRCGDRVAIDGYPNISFRFEPAGLGQVIYNLGRPIHTCDPASLEPAGRTSRSSG
jgi:hypothetical protein